MLGNLISSPLFQYSPGMIFGTTSKKIVTRSKKDHLLPILFQAEEFLIELKKISLKLEKKVRIETDARSVREYVGKHCVWIEKGEMRSRKNCETRQIKAEYLCGSMIPMNVAWFREPHNRLCGRKSGTRVVPQETLVLLLCMTSVVDESKCCVSRSIVCVA